MSRTSGSVARHARSIFIAVTLVASSVLAFSPVVPAATVLSADADPSTSPDPTPDPTVEPTPEEGPDPTPPVAEPAPTQTTDPPTTTPEPTHDPSPLPTAAPTEPPSPAPGDTVEPTPPPEPGPTGPVAPTGSPDAGAPSPTPTSAASGPGEPSPDPASSLVPGADPPAASPGPGQPSATAGQYAIRFDAADRGAAVGANPDAFQLRTFTVETWLVRQGPGTAVDDAAASPAASADSPTPDELVRRAVPVVARGSVAPPDDADVPPPAYDRLNWLLGVDTITGALVAAFQDDTGETHVVAGGTAVRLDAWHHAATTFDGEVLRLYLDGRLEAELAANGAEPDPAGRAPVSLATTVAGDGTTSRGSFDGILDETQIWATARSAIAIRDDMRRAIDPVAVGFVAGWPMDDGAGAIVAGVGRPGVMLSLYGATEWPVSPLPDDVAPAAPRSLAAVAARDGITLAWTPVAADDLAGYRIYRTTGETVDPSAVPLGGWAPVAANAFLDDTATVGVAYRYAVVAVDRYDNQSVPTSDAVATVAPPDEAPTPVAVRIDLSASDPPPGLRLDPGAPIVVRIDVTPAADLPAGRLLLAVPAGWTITDPDGGVPAEDGSSIAWTMADAAGGVESRRAVALTAPLTSPVDGARSFHSTFVATLEQPGGTTTGPELDIMVAPGLFADHVVVGRPGADVDSAATYLPQDAPLAGQPRFAVARVRFRLENRGDAPAAVTPQLEVRGPAGGIPAEYTIVPPGRSLPGLPFYATREWVPVSALAIGAAVPNGVPRGTVLGGAGEQIDGAFLLTMGDPGDPLAPSPGEAVTGRNPGPTLTLPAGSFTEVEFSVRATADAVYGTAYGFRLTDGGQPLTGAAVATIEMATEAPRLLSPGQRHGQAVGSPGSPSGGSAGTLAYELRPSGDASPAPRYALLGSAPVHGAGAGSGNCAICHDSHAAAGPNLLSRAGPQAAVCFTCHDSAGTGSSDRVEAAYLDPAVPQNDPSSGSYFRHDALATGSRHAQAAIDEFGGRLDRHQECADCHDPHVVTADDAAQTEAGWTASGRIAGTSGVAVVNGPAGSAPTYGFLDGSTGKVALEYQLCFKCHSGFTTLPGRSPDHPSRWALDKGVELNPSNASYHPIEAPGRTGTGAMAASLLGTSPYKLWDFTPGSTIRCLNCHGDSRTADDATPPSAGSNLSPHTSATVTATDGTELNRGILLRPYRDRVLKGSADAYDPQDSALCLTCHGQAPFADASGDARPDTAFRYHGLHVAGLAGKGAIAGDIDTPGAGLGNALCSECHYRIHSTASRNDFRTDGTAQTGTDGGLVLFAPNVTGDDAVGSRVDWTRGAPSAGSCTLTCHGREHAEEPY